MAKPLAIQRGEKKTAKKTKKLGEKNEPLSSARPAV
jgi:hypothetical protein